MTDATQPGGSPAGGNDPWAPPEHRTSLDKGASTGPGQHIPGTPPAAGGPAGTQPPSVHDQPTVVSMPAAGPTPPGATPPGGVPPYGAPGAPLPPPPVAPTGPGAPMPPGVPMGHGGPAGYGYPGYPQGYGWSGMPLPPQNGAGTAAMVLGILACCMFCAYGVVSVVLGILAIVFGIKGRKRVAEGLADNHSQAQTGLITGIIGLILGLAVVVVIVVSIVVAVNSESTYEDDDDYYYGARRPVVTAPVLG